MAKNQPAGPARPAGLTRKHEARLARERRLQRWLLIGLGLVLASALGLIGYAVLDQEVIQKRQPVAVINGVEISTGEFQKQVRYARTILINQYWRTAQFADIFGNSAQFQSQLEQIQGSLNNSFSLGREVLDRLIEDELIRQEAVKRGLTVSAEEVDSLIQARFGFFPNGTPTPEPTSTQPPSASPSEGGTATLAPGQPTQPPSATPPVGGSERGTATPAPTSTPAPTDTPTAGPSPSPSPTATITPTPTPYTAELYARDYRDYLARFDETAGMSEADIRRLFEIELLRKKLVEGWEATPQVSLVHARHILVADEATALDLLAKLRNGEDFAALAAENSLDTSNKDQGGDLGFFGRGQMVPEFEQAAFDSPIGLVPAPVKTTFGYHVIEVLDKRDETPDEARERAFSNWLTAQREDPNVVQTFDYWENRVPTEPRFDPVTPPTAFPTSAP